MIWYILLGVGIGVAGVGLCSLIAELRRLDKAALQEGKQAVINRQIGEYFLRNGRRDAS